MGFSSRFVGLTASLVVSCIAGTASAATDVWVASSSYKSVVKVTSTAGTAFLVTSKAAVPPGYVCAVGAAAPVAGSWANWVSGGKLSATSASLAVLSLDGFAPVSKGAIVRDLDDLLATDGGGAFAYGSSAPTKELADLLATDGGGAFAYGGGSVSKGGSVMTDIGGLISYDLKPILGTGLRGVVSVSKSAASMLRSMGALDALRPVAVCTPVPATSCTLSCGDQAPAGCWCDDLCAKYGDCCGDAAAACGD